VATSLKIGWRAGLAGLLLGLTLVTPYLLGAVGAYAEIVCVGLMLVVLALRRERLAIAGDPAAKLLLAAPALLAVAFVFTAKTPHDALYAFNFLMLAAFAPASAYLAGFAGPDNLRRVAMLALLGALVAAVLALGDVLLLHQERASGWETDPIWSAEAAVLLGFVAGLGAGLPGRWRLLYLAGPLLGLVTCLLSGSRGPLLAVPILLLVLVAGVATRRLQALALTVAAGMLALVVVRFTLPSAFDRVLSLGDMGRQLATSGTVAEISGGTRLAFYKAGWDAFLHAPVLGYGWAGKMQAIVPYLPGDGEALIAPHLHLHSDSLDFGVSGGVVGLLAYLLILAAPVAGAFAGPRDSQFRLRLTGALLLATGYFVCGLTYLMFGYEFHTTLYVCLSAILIGYCRDRPPSPPPQAGEGKRALPMVRGSPRARTSP